MQRVNLPGRDACYQFFVKPLPNEDSHHVIKLGMSIRVILTILSLNNCNLLIWWLYGHVYVYCLLELLRQSFVVTLFLYLNFVG